MKQKRVIAVTGAICAGMILAISSGLPAQQRPSYLDAGSKMRGDFGRGFRPHTARTYTSQAYNNAGVLYYYGQNYPQLPPATAREHVQEVRRNLDAARKEYAKIGPELTQQPDLKPHITAIDQGLARVNQTCQMLEQHVKSGQFQLGPVCDHCLNIAKELKAVESEHDQLMKKLGIEPIKLPVQQPVQSAPQK